MSLVHVGTKHPEPVTHHVHPCAFHPEQFNLTLNSAPWLVFKALHLQHQGGHSKYVV